jgi:hypothetical protein
MDLPRTATVRADERSMLLEIHKKYLKRFMELAPPDARDELTRVVRERCAHSFKAYGIPFFERIPEDMFALLGEMMDTIEYPKGRAVFNEGDSGDQFYIIVSGQVKISVSSDEKGRRITKEVNRLGPGGYFGEIALVRDVPRSATVVTTEPCMMLTSFVFFFFCGICPTVSFSNSQPKKFRYFFPRSPRRVAFSLSTKFPILPVWPISTSNSPVTTSSFSISSNIPSVSNTFENSSISKNQPKQSTFGKPSTSSNKWPKPKKATPNSVVLRSPNALKKSLKHSSMTSTSTVMPKTKLKHAFKPSRQTFQATCSPRLRAKFSLSSKAIHSFDSNDMNFSANSSKKQACTHETIKCILMTLLAREHAKFWLMPSEKKAKNSFQRFKVPRANAFEAEEHAKAPPPMKIATAWLAAAILAQNQTLAGLFQLRRVVQLRTQCSVRLRLCLWGSFRLIRSQKSRSRL